MVQVIGQDHPTFLEFCPRLEDNFPKSNIRANRWNTDYSKYTKWLKLVWNILLERLLK